MDSNGDGSGTLLVDWIRLVDSDPPDNVSCDGVSQPRFHGICRHLE